MRIDVRYVFCHGSYVRSQRLMRRYFLGLLFAVYISSSGATPALQNGDIVFQTSRSSQSVAIQRATGSKYSHMGMVIYRSGKPYVFEAAATVRYTPLNQWIDRGVGHHFVAKRLRNAESLLSEEALQRLRTVASQFLGHPYDLFFGWADDRIYCSELVWKVYDRALDIKLGELERVRDFNLSDPAVKAKMRERYGSNIPLTESVISPVAMFESPLLVTVAEQ